MSTPGQRYRRCAVELRVARAQLLLQLASHSWNADRLADLLTFAAQIGDDATACDTVAAFCAAQTELLRDAQAELELLDADEPS